MALLVMATALVVDPGRASAQAFCALRDPVAQIFGLFEEADGYRSEVRTVEPSVLQTVSERLGYGLHRSELGRHTVYVALREGHPLGVVHVRSERSRWGLVEVAWALDAELRVIDFAVQRCRSSLCKSVSGDAFRGLLRGRGFEEVAALVSKDGRRLSAEGASVGGVPARAASLAAAVVRNGLKTIVVTESLWSDVIAAIDNTHDRGVDRSLPAAIR